MTTDAPFLAPLGTDLWNDPRVVAIANEVARHACEPLHERIQELERELEEYRNYYPDEGQF